MTDQQEAKTLHLKAISHFTDSNLRVAYAAINTVGQISQDHAPSIQKNTHRQTIEPLLKIMETSQHAKYCSTRMSFIVSTNFLGTHKRFRKFFLLVFLD